MEETERYDRGWKKLRETNETAARQLLDSLGDVAPDLGRYIVEFAYGDVLSRPGLDPGSRELVSIGILAALNVGCTREEIVETLIQTAVYAGFPAALNGTAIAGRVFLERDGNGTSR